MSRNTAEADALRKIASLVCIYDGDDDTLMPSEACYRTIHVICEGVLGRDEMKRLLAEWHETERKRQARARGKGFIR